VVAAAITWTIAFGITTVIAVGRERLATFPAKWYIDVVDGRYVIELQGTSLGFQDTVSIESPAIRQYLEKNRPASVQLKLLCTFDFGKIRAYSANPVYIDGISADRMYDSNFPAIDPSPPGTSDTGFLATRPAATTLKP